MRALKERDAERARAAIVTHLQHARRNLFGFELRNQSRDEYG